MSHEQLAKLLTGVKRSRRTPAARTATPDTTLRLWLDQLRPFNAGPDFDWEPLLQDFLTDPDNAPEWAKEHRILLLITLYSYREKYLVMIKEALESDPVVPMYIIAVTVHRNEVVVQAQRALKANYEASSSDPARREVSEIRTVWAENFEAENLLKALDRAAVAILSEELDARRFDLPGSRTTETELEKTQDELETNLQAMLERIAPKKLSKEDIIESWEKLPKLERQEVLTAIKKRIDEGVKR